MDFNVNDLLVKNEIFVNGYRLKILWMKIMLLSKKMNIFNKIVALFVFSIFFMSAHAQEAKIGNIKIEGAYVRSTVPGQKSAAGFMKIISQGNSD